MTPTQHAFLPIALSIACLVAVHVECGATEFYVSPAGDEASSGAADRPFATLGRAQQAVRALTSRGLTEDVTVRVGEGVYLLSEPLRFDPRDGGTDEHTVRYLADAGANPVISGGRRIAGWQRAGEEVWAVTLPEVKAGGWHFRQLFVDGKRAVRARTPNATATEYCFRLTGAKLAKDLSRYTLSLPQGTVKQWRNLEDVEAVVLKNWANLRKRVASVDPATGTVVLSPPHVKYFGGNAPRKGGGCFFENSPDFLDEPGEWYLDRHSGVLSYRPLPGQDMTTAKVFAPALTHLVAVEGAPDQPVRNLHFEGLSFMHADRPLPPEGHHGRQGAFRYGGGSMECALRFTWAHGCSLVGCKVTHIGGSGVDLGEGCQDCVLEGNEVADVEANGLNCGGPDDPVGIPKQNRLANNWVHHCGEVYYGACALWAGFAQETTIAHNLIHDHPYTGISIGWKWDDKPTNARAYLVEYNHVYDVMKQVCDGGAIYSLGWNPGTVIRGNHLHHVHRSRYAIAAPNNGIFMDQGSKGFLVEGNVLHDIAGAPVRHNQNKAEWHTWRDNRFDSGRLAKEPRAVEGKVGNGMLCGHVDFPHTAALDPEQLTLAAWIKPASLPVGRQWIANKNDDEWTEGYFGLFVNNASAGAYLNIGGSKANRFAVTGQRPLTAGHWHHLVMTYDGADLVLYVDGEREGSLSLNRKRKPGRLPFTIGRRQDGWESSQFRGVIDEVRLFSRPLKPQEVRLLTTQPTALETDAAAVGSWGFEDLPLADQETVEADLGLASQAGLEAKWRKRLLGE